MVALCAALQAQTDYYKGVEIIKGDGFTYVCDRPFSGRRIILHDINSRYYGVDWTFKDGSPLTEDIYFEGEGIIVDDDWTRPKALSIVNGAFTAEQGAFLNGKTFSVDMRISPETGKVVEVYFKFYANSPFVRIPPEVFRDIEQRLKEEVWFTITPLGKRLNYLQCGWVHTVKASGATPPTPPVIVTPPVIPPSGPESPVSGHSEMPT